MSTEKQLLSLESVKLRDTRKDMLDTLISQLENNLPYDDSSSNESILAKKLIECVKANPYYRKQQNALLRFFGAPFHNHKLNKEKLQLTHWALCRLKDILLTSTSDSGRESPVSTSSVIMNTDQIQTILKHASEVLRYDAIIKVNAYMNIIKYIPDPDSFEEILGIKSELKGNFITEGDMSNELIVAINDNPYLPNILPRQENSSSLTPILD
ncbi:MAG: hypothetical protein JXR42_02220 [Gammaproteobacteria bacterium]|nr:hypothetical protein [Gammaproteobacteria bacterium]